MEILWTALFLWVVVGYIVGPTMITTWDRYYLNYSEEKLRVVDFEQGFALCFAIVVWPIVVCVYGADVYKLTNFAQRRREAKVKRPPKRTVFFAFPVWLSGKLGGIINNRRDKSNRQGELK